MINKIKIYRFELYPNDEPTQYWVGFSVEVDQHQPFLMDTYVAIADCADMTEEEICDVAYNNLKDAIQIRADELGAKSPVVGVEYTPK
jgi:hypothetical protein